MAQTVKNLPAVQETQGQSLGQEDPRERNGSPLQYSCLENPVDKNLAGYIPWGHRESETTERLSMHTAK